MTIEMVKAIPMNGLLVPKEDRSGFLDAKGERVPLTTYYRRREADQEIHIERDSDESSTAKPVAPASVASKTGGE